LRIWSAVEEWGPEEVGLASRITDPERLVNALAEHQYGAFGTRYGLGPAALAAGAVLGLRAGEIAGFHERAMIFLTRIVGCLHEGRLEHLDDLRAGDQVVLIPEPDNPFDGNAVRAALPGGPTLGYLRRTIARKLAARMLGGANLQGKVAVLLGPSYGPNDRLYVVVTVVEDGETALT